MFKILNVLLNITMKNSVWLEGFRTINGISHIITFFNHLKSLTYNRLHSSLNKLVKSLKCQKKHDTAKGKKIFL